MDCDEFSPLTAELALGVLAGRERADAIAHLERCDDCRETVRQLAMTGEELVQLLPAVEPPPGFETRVMNRIGAGVSSDTPVPSDSRGRHRRRLPRPGRPRRVLAVAAVAVAVVAAGLGGWGLRTAAAPVSAPSPLSAAAMLSAGRAPVGHVYFYAGRSPWLYMSVDVGQGNTAVTCQLRGPDGRYTTLGTFRLNDGYGYWASPVAPARGPVTGARLVTPAGAVLATARF